MIEDAFPSRDRVPLIAPFNADVDFGGYEPGFLSYRLDTTPAILSRATEAVMATSAYAHELPDFQATLTVIVTWHDAGFFRANPNDPRVVSLKITHCSHAAGLNLLYLKNGFPS